MNIEVGCNKVGEVDTLVVTCDRQAVKESADNLDSYLIRMFHTPFRDPGIHFVQLLGETVIDIPVILSVTCTDTTTPLVLIRVPVFLLYCQTG